MEIEIVTTKKKLSLSIVKQMKLASYSDISFAMKDPGFRVLGYITNFPYKKVVTSMALIRGLNDWCLYPMHNPSVIKNVSREAHPDRREYRTIDVTHYSVHQKIGMLSLVSKYNESEEQANTACENGKALIEFAKGLHIYL
ncbi:hypothetical protein BI049_gp091 [Salmonella phage vB_SnwM_CGG4-1]|uniref:Uncharacterized protein n=1 Tax=Salmonella phage vB_SnwM_CGG4-1 TaxID=1815631 RepID=A0A1B0VVG3_9CAUD|nr:hypothetical protein BI049_gp091 [Salmonella phage vB_SnwM_CGG4-1]ANA49445.1 hypothetical protein CGG41_090 [Salmonella phage vB_SnwM_CGG4-1]